MEAFLSAVDETPPANLAALVTGLANSGFTLPAQLNKAEPAEVICEFPTTGEGKLLPAGKSFLRRSIEKATQKPGVPPSLPEPPAQPPRVDRLEELFGVEVNAETVAAALAAKPTQVEVHELLAKINCTSLPSAMIIEVAIWQALAADTELAKKKGKQAFTYVDFTAKAMLPTWLPADLVGGKKRKEGAPGLDPRFQYLLLASALSSFAVGSG